MLLDTLGANKLCRETITGGEGKFRAGQDF